MEEVKDVGGAKETPLEKELGKVQRDLTKYGQDMRAAGITAEQIEGAITKAQERIQKEFEERERQDPLEIVKEALQEAAQTEDERLIANAWCREIDQSRSRLTKYVKDPQELRREDPFYADWRKDGKWARVTVLSGPIEVVENRKILISREFQERFLRNLGALEDNEKLVDLFDRNFPIINSREGFESQPKGPVYEKDPQTGHNWVLRVPTHTPGVDAETDGWAIRISIAPEALPKIQPKK